jgi:hypothetical protein
MAASLALRLGSGLLVGREDWPEGHVESTAQASCSSVSPNDSVVSMESWLSTSQQGPLGLGADIDPFDSGVVTVLKRFASSSDPTAQSMPKSKSVSEALDKSSPRIIGSSIYC